jgi:two-component system, NarL family, sensor kinase
MIKKNKCLRNYFFVIFLILLNLAFQVSASDEKTDSLRQIIENSLSDEEVVNAMLTLAKEFRSAHMSDSARIYAERALGISNRINYTEGIAGSKLLICIDQWSNSRFAEAQVSISEVIRLVKQIDDPEKLGKAYYHQGVILGMTGETDSAILYFKKSLTLTQRDSITIIASNLGLGNVFSNRGEYDSSLSYKLNAARIAEVTGKRDNLSAIYSGIGIILNELGEFEEAKTYFRKSLEISRQINDSLGIASSFLNLAGGFYRNERYSEALSYLDSANALFTSAGVLNRDDLFIGYALIYESQGKYDLALKYYDKTLKITKEEGYPDGMIVAYRNKSVVLSKLNRLDEARECLDSGLNIALEKGYRHEQINSTYLLAENSYASGNYKQAYEELRSYTDQKDSLFNLDKAEVIAELKQKYEKEKDQAQILKLEKESLKKTLQRNLILFNASALIVAAIFILMILRHKLVKTKMISQQKIQQLEEEKKMMMARNLVEGQEEERKRIAMELHDGLGVILSATKMQFSTVPSDLLKDSKVLDKAIHLLEQATGEVRRISHNMMPGLLTKLGLYEAVEDLFDNLNEMKDMQAHAEIQGNKSRLPENNEIMIYRIIQEMVNNTLKYAKAHRIDLSIKISNPHMTIHYQDDGIGFDVNEKINSGIKSLGLKSIESRVAFLNGELKINSAPGKGVDFLIVIPVVFDQVN